MDAQMSSQMSSQISSPLSDELMSAVEADDIAVTEVHFTNDELAALERLQVNYQPVGDFLTPDEVARLEFVRWLYQTGRVQP